MKQTPNSRTGNGRSYSAALPFIIVLLGLSCSLVAGRLLGRSEDRLAETGFETATHEQLLAVQEQFDESIAALVDLASLYAVSGEVPSEAFTVFVDPILARNTALKGLSWNPVVRHEERAAYEEAMRAAGADGYQIVEMNEFGELIPALERKQYVVVSEIGPIEGNERAIGFDVYSEGIRREALDRARDTGELTIAVPINLVQAGEESTGALAFLPRFREGTSTSTLEARRANIIGYFVSVVDVGETIRAARATLDPVDIDMQLANSREAGSELLFTSSPNAGSASAGLETEADFAWGDRQLTLRFIEGESFSNQYRTIVPVAALFGGLLMTVLAAAYVRVLQQRASRIKREVAKRTDDLRQANLGLEAEIERRTKAELELEAYRDELERQVSDRTAELEFTSNQLRAIVDSEPECVKLLSAEGALLDMNPAGLRMIEAESIEQVRGLCVYDLVSPADRAQFVELNERVMAGESGTLEFEIVGLRGTTRRMETHAVPLVMADDESPLHLAITRDVTERARAERERLALEAQLRHSTKLRSIGVLAGGIAHDFNNLLHVVVGNTEIALESAADERSLAALRASRFAATEASKLCDQMLTYAGESRPEVRPVSLPAIVDSMLELLEVSHPKKVDLRIEMQEPLGTIEGDDAQLGQVVVNLVTNASDAIGDEPGQVHVTVRAVDVETTPDDQIWLDSAPPSGRYVALVVTDTGSGMSADELEVIFDPFYTTKFKGRGLGLSSTLGIVRSHGGHVNVTSAVGEGSTFTVLFPASSQPLPDRAPTPPGDSVELRGSVLVADDEPLILSVVTDLLESLGLGVHAATDGEAALQVFADHEDEIDLAILDVTMPKLDGNETAKALRELHPDLGIIFCSGYAAHIADEPIPGGGFIGFLHKPYGRAELISTLNEASESTTWARS